MRKRTKFLIFLIIFIISLSFGFSGKTKVYTKNGVTIMENQESDFTINKNIKFKENLSIGKEDDEDYEIFSQYLSIAVSQNGDLFIFDGKRYRILKFDKMENTSGAKEGKEKDQENLETSFAISMLAHQTIL